MPTTMKVQMAVLKGFLRCVTVVLAMVGWAAPGFSQALLVERLPGGTHLVVVNQPLADATTVVWPSPSDDDPEARAELIGGRLTLMADLEAAFAVPDELEDPLPVPPVVVAVGGASAEELSALLARVLGDRPVFDLTRTSPPVLVEGGLDRRLGAPGSDAVLRLEVLMPPAGDWRRSSVEVLWELVPKLVADSVPYLSSRLEDRVGVLEGRVDAEMAELVVSGLRLQLARFASDPALAADDVAEARRRLQVRRHAVLEEHPEAANHVFDRWRSGGEGAVREYVFGIQGVTVSSVRDAAAEWLPYHPGRAQLILPPRVYNPRFAIGPETHRLSNDLTASVLERSGAPLSVICLRPVMVPDLDGEVTATILARLARELRSAGSRPGFVRVRSHPPLIELAGPSDGFGELMEQLGTAYRAVISDQTPVADSGGDSRRRALDLMSGLLGITEAEAPSPASLLRPGNLALGVVATDAEAAAEAFGKFWSAEDLSGGGTDVQSVPTVVRTRVAAPGETSSVAVALEMGFGGMEAISLVTRELLANRAGRLWPDSRVEILAPYVPGRALLVFVLTAPGDIDELESVVLGQWPDLTSAASEDELAPVRRRVAAAASAELSGVAGHARRCAATAAGAARWHQPAEFELEILTVGPELVSEVMKGFAAFEELETTAAGVLPIDEIAGR
jgi:hypothetical protein